MNGKTYFANSLQCVAYFNAENAPFNDSLPRYTPAALPPFDRYITKCDLVLYYNCRKATRQSTATSPSYNGYPSVSRDISINSSDMFFNI